MSMSYLEKIYEVFFFTFIVIFLIVVSIYSLDKLLTIKENSVVNDSKVSVFIDDETGVNYLITNNPSSNKNGVSIVPRYNADGTLYVTTTQK